MRVLSHNMAFFVFAADVWDHSRQWGSKSLADCGGGIVCDVISRQTHWGVCRLRYVTCGFHGV